MIKQTMTPERMNRIKYSIQLMAILAETIKLEYAMDMDTRFKSPQVNQFAGRISKDAQAIQQHLQTINMQLKVNPDFLEEYAAAIHRVVRFFAGLPVDQINEAMNNIANVAECVEGALNDGK